MLQQRATKGATKDGHAWRRNGALLVELTARQIEIVMLAASGLSSKQIARELNISARTVDDHMLAIRNGVGAAGRGELIARSYAAGILSGWPPQPSGTHMMPTAREALGTSRSSAVPRSRSIFTSDDVGSIPMSSDAESGSHFRKPDLITGASGNSPSLASSGSAGHAVVEFPVPPTAGGELIGYAWAPFEDRSIKRQLNALAAVGCRRVFTDDRPDGDIERPGLRSLLEHTHPGDVLVVWSLDRVCHSIEELIFLIDQLHSNGVEFKSLREILDTTVPGGWMIFLVFAALADFWVNQTSWRLPLRSPGSAQCCLAYVPLLSLNSLLSQ